MRQQVKHANGGLGAREVRRRAAGITEPVTRAEREAIAKAGNAEAIAKMTKSMNGGKK